MSVSLLPSVQQYQRAYDQALALYSVFEDADAAELNQQRQLLAAECEQFIKLSGLDWSQCGNLARHLAFLKHYLERDGKGSCSQDIRDIVFSDLPAGLRSLIAAASEQPNLDQRLRDTVVPLMHGAHYDSAVRKVFVVLTDRLRRAFGVETELDGEDLVNVVFGKGGKLPLKLEDGKKQAMRNLVSGFYSVYRNRFAHNDIVPAESEANSIIQMANTILLEIESIASASAGDA